MGHDFAVIGCDNKMKSCKTELVRLGFGAECLDSERLKEINKFRRIVLPLPTLKNGCISGVPFEEFCKRLKPEQTVFCGNISPEAFPCKAFSYYYNEDFLVKNSRLTAQGVLRIVLESINTDLRTISAAVIGYGRCGKEICKLLKLNGIDVTSFSRRVQTLTAAQIDGMKTEKIIDINNRLSSFDIIINTVPCNIIEKSGLKSLTQRNLYIEIASKPYGFDTDSTDKSDFRYVLAQSLPGKFTPVSAGINIAEAVVGILKEDKSNE